MWKAYKAFKQEELPSNYFRAVTKVLRISGLEVEKDESFLYKIYTQIVLFIWLFSYTGVETYEFYHSIGNLNAMLNVLNYLITHIVGIIKICDIYLNREKYKTIMKKIQEGLFAPDEIRGGPEEKIIIRKTIKITEIQLIVFFMTITFVVLGSVLELIKARLFKSRDHWDMPFMNLSLVDTSSSPAYEGAVAYQFFCVTAQGLQIATTDVLRTSLMAHVSVQLKLLHNSIRRLKERAMFMHSQLKGEKSFQYCIDKCIAESVEHHLSIFQYAQELEHLGSSVIFVVMFGSVLQLCLIMYGTSLVPLTSFSFIQLMSYWIGVAFQTGQYCYWGNEVTLQSEGVAKGAAECDWPDFPESSKKALILIMTRTQRKLNMTAGNFVPLSVEFFVSLVKGSFSYYMVLKSMNDDK